MSRAATHEEWEKEAIGLFGPNTLDWKFVCPACGVATAVREWLEVGAEKQVAFSCIGRSTKAKREAFGGKGPGPCNYAGGGLFRLNPVAVTMKSGEVNTVFEFYRAPVPKGVAAS